MMSMLRPLLFVIALMPAIASASTFAEPRVRGGILSPPVAYGDFIYVPSGISIEVWDATDAAHPTRIPFALNPLPQGTIFGLAVVGTTLYVGWSDDARTTGGFEIYSLADPAHPARIGAADTTYARSLSANGHYLYEVDGQFGVTAIDASDPAHPVVAGTATGDFLLPENIEAVQIANGHMYVSGSALIESASAVIFDLADPAHPLAVGGMYFGEFGAIEAVSDSGYALVFGDSSGIYDVRDPANATLVGTLPDSGVPPNVEGSELAAFRGDDLYLFGGDDLPVLDVSAPAQPVEIADAAIDTNDLFALVPIGTGFFAETTDGRGVLIDASSPASPSASSEIAVPSGISINTAALDDRNAYLTGEGHVLEIVDSATLDSLGVIDVAADDLGNLLWNAKIIGVSGTTAIMAGNLVLDAVDVGDPTNPHLIGYVPVDLGYSESVVSGDRAYVTTLDGSLTVIDIADPSAFVVRGALTGFSYAPYAAAGSLVFTYGSDASLREGMYIVDASNADDPVAAGFYAACNQTGFASLAVTDDASTVGIACYDGSIGIVDASDPSNPTLVTTYRPSDPTAAATVVAARGKTFYLGNLHGIDELDVSDPAAPAFVVRYPTASAVRAMRLAPNGSLLALTDAGMYVFDCIASDGARPAPCREGGRTTTPPHAHSQHARATR